MKFWKMNGAGNDFIILDNRQTRFDPETLGRIAAALCPRRFAVGADGLMAVVEPSRGGDYGMLFFNAGGTMGEMCGNGARCICRFGHDMGLAGDVQRVETTAGLVVGHRLAEDQYRVELNLPSVMDFDRMTALGPCGYVELGDPGVPHSLCPVEGLREKSLEELRPMGYALRHEPAYPKGANANLYELVSEDHLVLRTYERGVEDFTYACGTGTGALVAMLTLQGKVSGRAVRVENPGGLLTVDASVVDGNLVSLQLTGPAAMVYAGQVELPMNL